MNDHEAEPMRLYRASRRFALFLIGFLLFFGFLTGYLVMFTTALLLVVFDYLNGLVLRTLGPFPVEDS